MTTTTIDIDTGGTFTDAFVVRAGHAHAVKVLTTPHDLALCFQQVVERAAEELDLTVAELLRETACVRYATTVGTNAIIQRTGPRIGLIAGPGGGRLYSANGGAEAVFERFLDGDMLVEVGEPADAGDRAELVVEAMKDLLGRSARGLVCAMPGAGAAEAETAVRRRFEAHYPKHCLDSVPLLLSHEIDADPDDFRRTATALFNAYVHPDVARYLYRAEDFLRDHGYRRPLLVVHNDGGCARVAKTVAGKTYNSGPTAGVMGAEVIARLYDLPSIVTFDMGGTSLDVAFVAGGRAPMREHGRVEGVEVSFSMPELLVLGAGGGSIAHVADGELRVGPRSAGARPGPACFGLGGTEPTVTDADVVLGLIDPERFLGGRIALDAQRARQAIQPLADALGEEAQTIAARIRSTVHDTMGARVAAELRERDLDPAQTVMLAYGGAGPTHACGVAERVGIDEIVTLPFAAVFSAFGASSADVQHTHTAAVRKRGQTPDSQADVEAGLRRRALRDMQGEGFSVDDVELAAGEGLRHGAPHAVVRVTAALEHYAFAAEPAGDRAAQAAAERDVVWPGAGAGAGAGAKATAIHRFDDLGRGAALAGPAVIEADDTTYAVPDGWRYRVDEYGNGRLTRER